MTEAEWLACTNPHKLLRAVWERMTPRQALLLVAAYAWRVWQWVPSEIPNTVLRLLESMLEPEAPPAEPGTVDAALEVVRAALARSDCPSARLIGTGRHMSFLDNVSDIMLLVRVIKTAPRAGLVSTVKERRGKERRVQRRILLDIVGNPFRRVVLATSWLTPTVRELVQAAYDGRLPLGHLELDRLAVLSDALEEAGCDDAAILDHLRGPGPHVRGCWVFDLLLGKA